MDSNQVIPRRREAEHAGNQGRREDVIDAERGPAVAVAGLAVTPSSRGVWDAAVADEKMTDDSSQPGWGANVGLHVTLAVAGRTAFLCRPGNDSINLEDTRTFRYMHHAARSGCLQRIRAAGRFGGWVFFHDGAFRGL